MSLEQWLPGLKPGMPEAFEKLAEIFRAQVFELYPGEGSGEKGMDYYIPYMMNDALECYLILRNCRISGVSRPYEGKEKPLSVKGELVTEKGLMGLIIREAYESGEAFTYTLWFEEISQVLNCYQYHEIGHFWVKGQEQWRRLVYMLGIMYDKYEYMGDTVCNEEEKALLRLMEFPPLRDWSPVNDSLEDIYPGTVEGVEAMALLALEAGDTFYGRLLRIYGKRPSRWMERWLKKLLLRPEREGLYGLIYEKIRQASLKYPPRRYPDKIEKEIEEKRNAVDQELKKRGFSGSYPHYYKEGLEITAAEEHPFTIMEWEHVSFRIRFMVSRIPGSCKPGQCSGFFKGKGRKGWIAEDLSFLE